MIFEMKCIFLFPLFSETKETSSDAKIVSGTFWMSRCWDLKMIDNECLPKSPIVIDASPLVMEPLHMPLECHDSCQIDPRLRLNTNAANADSELGLNLDNAFTFIDLT